MAPFCIFMFIFYEKVVVVNSFDVDSLLGLVQMYASLTLKRTLIFLINEIKLIYVHVAFRLLPERSYHSDLHINIVTAIQITPLRES